MTAEEKCVVTGASGFIGSALIPVLLRQGMEITAVSRTVSDANRLATRHVTWKAADVTRPQTLQDLFAEADYVVHAAGRLGKAGVAESEYLRLHVEGTRNVLDEISKHSLAPKVLYLSSPGVLGPITGDPANETSPLGPSNAYERSKAAAEEVVLSYARAGLPVVIARPEFVYGPGDTHVLGLFEAIQRGRFFYIGAGLNTCHPTFIDDAVDGLWRCLDSGEPGEIYHITGPRPVTFRELAETIANALAVPPPRLHVPKLAALAVVSGFEAASRLTGWQPPLSRTGVAFFSEDRRFSWSKAQRDLEYQPKYDLHEGIEKTVKWYQEHGYLSYLPLPAA